MFLPKVTRWALPVSAVAIAFGLAGCPGPTPTADSPAGTGASPAANAGAGVRLSGAGATFPAPIYQRWFAEYQKLTGTQISYQSVGSGAGVNQFLAKTVDFGASDAPLTEEEKKKYPNTAGKPLQVPMTGGLLVFGYNLDGVDNLKLSRDAYCGITEGRIKKWNDPAITKDNPGAKLPDADINFVYRSDGSGTTFVFTNHIAAACPGWKGGAAKSVEWPVGIGAKGNEGVTAQIQQTKNSIGYIEYTYAKETGTKAATIQNKAGEFVEPSPEAASKALLGQPIPEDFALTVPDPTEKDSYPIVGLTWLLVYSQYDDPAKAQAIKDMIAWALKDGAKFASELGYIPIPEEVAGRVQTALATGIKTK